MKRYLLSIFILFSIVGEVKSQSVTSQPYSADGAGPIIGNLISIQPPSGYPPYLSSGSWYIYNTKDSGKVAQSRASYFFEYGDGTYTTFDSVPHTYNTNTPQPALLTLRAKYDTIHPHSRITSHPIVPSTFDVSGKQMLLPTASPVGIPGAPLITVKNIMLASDVGDLIADDTIQTVLTFKKAFSESGKILVYYNKGLYAFKAISKNKNDTIRVLPWSRKISAIRTYQDSLFVDLIDSTPTLVSGNYGLPLVPSSLPTRAFKFVNDSIQAAGIPNILVFNLPKTFDQTKEHNIFITFVTNDNSIYNSPLSETSINAYILSDSLKLNADPTIRSSQLSPNSASLIFPIAQADPNSSNPNQVRPHDPNYIVADKKCTELCMSSNQPQRFNYHLHFQNDGEGEADSIVVSVYLHNKLNPQLLPNSISANVGGRPIIGNNLVVSSVQPFGDWNRVIFTLYNPGRIGKNVNLLGTKLVKMPETDIRTMGDVRFSVNSKSDSIPSYYSIASIVFNTETPVLTRMNRIRCCGRPIITDKDPIPAKPFGKKERIIKGRPVKIIDRKKEVGNLRSNG